VRSPRRCSTGSSSARFSGSATSSDYLIQKIEATQNISVRLRTETASGQVSGRLEGLTLRDNRSGATQTVPAAALFVMIGADPRTQWLRATPSVTSEAMC